MVALLTCDQITWSMRGAGKKESALRKHPLFNSSKHRNNFRFANEH